MATSTATSYPVSYTTSGTIKGTRYKNAIGKGADTSAVTGNDYSNGGSSSTAHIDYKFEFEGIPKNATIDSVTCRVKGHLENTSRSTANLQMYHGSTAKGTQTKFTSTSAQTITVTCGTWTREEIDDMYLRFTIGYYGGLVNGATVTVTYTWNDTKYTITTSATGVEIDPSGETEVYEGSDFTLKITDTEGITVTDNGTDVTSQLVEVQDTAETYSIENLGSYGFELNSSGYYVNENKGINKSASVCKVHFHVPVEATITFTYINYSEEGYDFGVFGNIDVPLSTSYYAAGSSGATITDSSYKLACNTSTHNKSSEQTLTYTMEAGDHDIYVKYSKDDASSSNNDTLQFKVAITLNEPFTPGTHLEYRLTNVTAAHTIVVTLGDTAKLYLKVSGNWVQVSKCYKKINGTWTEQTDLSTVFDPNANYVKG